MAVLQARGGVFEHVIQQCCFSLIFLGIWCRYLLAARGLSDVTHFTQAVEKLQRLGLDMAVPL